MPPYKKAVSEAQAGEFWMLEKQGKMSKSEAKGKTKGLKMKDLPKHIGDLAAV